MRLLIKLIIGFESALVSSAVWLWNVCTGLQEVGNIAVGVDGQQSQEIMVQTIQGIYPYQPLCAVLLVVAGIVGFAYWWYKE